MGLTWAGPGQVKWDVILGMLEWRFLGLTGLNRCCYDGGTNATALETQGAAAVGPIVAVPLSGLIIFGPECNKRDKWRKRFATGHVLEGMIFDQVCAQGAVQSKSNSN